MIGKGCALKFYIGIEVRFFSEGQITGAVTSFSVVITFDAILLLFDAVSLTN